MNENVWERFDGIATPEEVVDAQAQFRPLDEGTYRVMLEEIAPSTNKDGLPMIKGKFKVIEGGKVLFYNQNLQNINYPNLTAVNIAEAVSFVSGLLGEEITFNGMSDFAEKITMIPTGTEHLVKVSYGKKDYDHKFAKLEYVVSDDVFQSADDEGVFQPIDDEEKPF